MKTNQIATFFLLVTLAMACKQPSGTNYTISGEIQGFPEGSHIQLIPVSHEIENPLADTLIVNGKFNFKGTVKEPRAVLLKIKDTYGAKHLMLENKEIKITGKAASSESNGNTIYDFSNVSVNGSPLTNLYAKLISVRDSMDKKHQAYTMKYENATTALQNARNEKNRQAADSIMAAEEYKALIKAESEFFETVESSYKEIVMSHKDSYWGPLLMITLTSYLSQDMKLWYEEFSPEAKKSYYGQKVYAELYPAGSLGEKTAEFTVKAQNGTETTFAELRQDKKYILIDFWASWCNPCLKEIPLLKDLYNRYSDKGFEIVSISIDKKEEDWKKKLKEVNLPWPNYLDRNGIADLYRVRVIPAMYLVDEQGVLVAENLRGEELNNLLTELLAEK